MAKKTPLRTFNDVLALLGGQRFDVAPAHDGAKRASNAVQVRKYGVAAEIAAAPDGTVEILARPGWLLNGEMRACWIAGTRNFSRRASWRSRLRRSICGRSMNLLKS